MSDSVRHRLQRIRARQRVRRRCGCNEPDQVIECMEDCDELLRMVARLATEKQEKN